jgi:LAS superfamily LD-carboxypeptidase LdcB
MIDLTVSADLVLGRDASANELFNGVPVHQAIVGPLTALRADAAKAGFDLRLVSGYRSFDRQLAIWNAKAKGDRAVLDSDGLPLDINTLTESELINAIMRWSALPGASRHHWGSDVDIYDAAAVSDDYAVQLTPEEVADSGVFGPMHQWLDLQFRNGSGHGFFRPYGVDRGGIAPERWHLSYAPLAVKCELLASPNLLYEVLSVVSELCLQESVLREFTELYARYVAVPVSSYPAEYVAQLINKVEL